MTYTKTYTTTVEEKWILDHWNDRSRNDEIQFIDLVNDARECEEDDDFILHLPAELIGTILGQLIERGLIERVEQPNDNFTYRRN